MRNFSLRFLSAALVFVLSPAAFGQVPDCGGLQEKGTPGRLYVLTGANGLQGALSARWVPLSAVIQTNESSQDIQLGYLVPSTQGAGETGSLIVKIARQSANRQSEQGASNSRIKLFRRAFSTTCKGRYFSDLRGFFGELIRPEVRTDVGVADYIYYHKTDTDSGQPDIYGFHIDYRDKNGNCVSTDDKRNGNRQQFLFASRTRDEGLVVANIKDNLGLVAKAYGAPEYLSKVLEDKRTRELMTGYLSFTKLETQLHQYKIPESACVLFSIENPERGEKVSIRLNNLEQRDANGRLLPASGRKEKSFPVEIR